MREKSSDFIIIDIDYDGKHYSSRVKHSYINVIPRKFVIPILVVETYRKLY